jgi:FkbH-like protein
MTPRSADLNPGTRLMLKSEHIARAKAERHVIKCVVYDLDNTIWDGVLLEDPQVRLREDALEAIRELDRRGILLSIASRNPHDLAMAKLREFGLGECFLYPQINWGAKSASIRTIATSLNLGLDALAFVDDQPFERDEVRFELPEVTCVNPADMRKTLDDPIMKPRFITHESSLRRKSYLSDIRRQQAEAEFTGPSEEFLHQSEIKFTIQRAREEDLQRAEELTVRTNQLNTTGYTYSYEELDVFRRSPEHLLLVASLEDKFGSYGTIGLSLVERGPVFWNIKLLLMSCRVMSRGVGTVLMQHLMARAKQANVRLRAEFIPNGRNRMMMVTYKFSGFTEVQREGDLSILENDLSRPVAPAPAYMKVEVLE